MSPSKKDWVIYEYDNEVSGNIAAAATVTSPWFNTQETSQLLLMGVFAGGTTAVTVEFSHDGVTVDQTSADQAGSLATGAALNNSYDYVRFKVAQTVADTTNAELTVKASD